MIFDRTIEDVQSAKKIRSEKFLKGISLTDEETEIMERGLLTIGTLNRIEQKQMELKGVFNVLAYWDTPIENKEWNYSDIFYAEDAKRLLQNTEILRRAFFDYVSTPDSPKNILRFDSVNAVEKILHDLQNMVETIMSLFRECGQTECGGD